MMRADSFSFFAMSQTIFIADLHLSDDTPELNRLFLQALQSWQGRVDALYILGDFFEVWLGDDILSNIAAEAAVALKTFSQSAPVYFICGNRDFLLGKRYAKQAGITLLPEQQVVQLYGQNYLISHGDEMCTADVSYQRFRRIIRCRLVQKLLLSLPQSRRQKVAAKLRAASKQKKQAMAEADASEKAENENKESKQSEQGKEFYTIQTASDKVFYLIIDRDGEEEMVYFLTEITENDLLNTTSDNSETLPKNSAALESAIPTSESALPNNNAEQGNKQEEDTEGTEEDTESTGEPEETEVKEQANPMISYILMGGLAVAVIGGAYYFKVVRKKKEDFIEDEDEDEEDNEEYENEDEESEDCSDDGFFEEQEEE